MVEGPQALFADVSLPVPLDREFTYALPETLHHRVARGCRLLVPLGTRRLHGVVLRVHADAPDYETKHALKLLDETPVLDEELIALGKWIASYYAAPLGEVLRGMTPLEGETHKSVVYSLTDTGRDVSRQMALGDAEKADPSKAILRMLEARSLSAAYLAKKVSNAARILQALAKKQLVQKEDVESSRDLLRASAARLRITGVTAPQPGVKLTKPEREIISYLELHPGTHNLLEVETSVKDASRVARSLARKNVLELQLETSSSPAFPPKPPRVLNEAQTVAIDAIGQCLVAHEFRTFLLHGVTGSGKTEVYLRSIEHCLQQGRSALLLVPEIALTPAVAGEFFHRFGDRVAILHSAFHTTERADQWRRIRSGEATVVIGTRSGIFAPLPNIGLIIVDEEHDQSYKQQETPRYHGRDVAIVRARSANACIVLGSATPGLESCYNVERAKYTLLEMPDRIEARAMPRVELIDMRIEFLETRKQSTFSRTLVTAIGHKLEAGEQVMLLHNRRGFSSFAACRACGWRQECVDCAVTLTFHRRDRRMLCHYCDYAAKVPSICPECSSEHIHFLGVGSEHVEDDLHRLFPQARIARLDRDTAGGKRHFETILAGFRDRDFDILVGTQMIAKGHDIPNVTLVGVVSADIGLGIPDFRAAERCFQLLTQVGGRAGRGHLPGTVLIQTINPDHYAIRMAAAHDFRAFYDHELNFRKQMSYPPFSALANIVVRSEQQEDALRKSAEIGHLLTPPPENVRVLGPAIAPVSRIKKEFRYQILIKAASRKVLGDVLRRLRSYTQERKWSATALVVDVDPMSLI